MIYNTSITWPVQQSITEQRQKSGLFTCSAEFIRPIGQPGLPTTIDTSIGSVDVWPEPTISRSTDGFERINATGYGVWDFDISESTYSLGVGYLPVRWNVISLCTIPGGCGNVLFGGYITEKLYTDFLPVIIESVHVRQLGEGIPVIPARESKPPAKTASPLKVLDVDGADITEKEFSLSDFPRAGYITESDYTGNFKAKIQTKTMLEMVKKNTYGTFFETEAVYSLFLDDLATSLNFGTFTSKVT